MLVKVIYPFVDVATGRPHHPRAVVTLDKETAQALIKSGVVKSHAENVLEDAKKFGIHSVVVESGHAELPALRAAAKTQGVKILTK